MLPLGMMLFTKEKSKLELAVDQVTSLIDQTNKKINELGQVDSDLYDALIHIQGQFDKIRNVPSDKQLQYESIKKVSLSWKEHVNKIENDYEEAKKANLSRAGGTTAAGIALAAFGPTAAMGVATTFGVASTGTAISALSGAAATNAALAWLGGGALAAGGGGMAAGNALLALAGPVGLFIAGSAMLVSALLFWKAKRDRDRLEQIFLLISQRDQNSYKQAIVELKERISRIIDETKKLKEATKMIATFGLDYMSMTKEQQYALGSYINLMNASTQLLVNPILGLQPKYTDTDLEKFRNMGMYATPSNLDLITSNSDLIIYMANLLYNIPLEESDCKLISESFKGNKKFRKEFHKGEKLKKSDLDINLFNLVDRVLAYKYRHQ